MTNWLPQAPGDKCSISDWVQQSERCDTDQGYYCLGPDGTTIGPSTNSVLSEPGRKIVCKTGECRASVDVSAHFSSGNAR